MSLNFLMSKTNLVLSCLLFVKFWSLKFDPAVSKLQLNMIFINQKKLSNIQFLKKSEASELLNRSKKQQSFNLEIIFVGNKLS